MTRFIVSSRSTAAPSPVRRRKSRHLSVRTLNIGVFGILIVFGVAYMLQINTIAVKGYKIKALEQRIADLKKSSQELEVNVLRLQSMDAIQGRVQALNLVAAGSPEFIGATPVAVAR